jgi:hypothetical protein
MIGSVKMAHVILIIDSNYEGLYNNNIYLIPLIKYIDIGHVTSLHQYANKQSTNEPQLYALTFIFAECALLEQDMVIFLPCFLISTSRGLHLLQH